MGMLWNKPLRRRDLRLCPNEPSGVAATKRAAIGRGCDSGSRAQAVRRGTSRACGDSAMAVRCGSCLTGRARLWRFVATIALLGLSAGCGGDAGGPRTAPAPNLPADARSQPQGRTAKSPSPREVWEVYLLKGQRVGYGTTKVQPEVKNGKELLRIEASQRYAIWRFDRMLEQEIWLTSLETPQGELLEFSTTVQQGEQPVKTVGRAVGNRLEMLIMSAGKTMPVNLPWSAEYGGFFRVDGSLLQKPLLPGEIRRLRVLVPGANTLGEVELKAAAVESVALPNGSKELLRIEAVLRMSGGEMRYTAWSDPAGEVLRTVYHDALGLEMVRSTREEALRPIPKSDFDLGWDVVVRLKQPIEDAHRRKSIRYHLTLPDADPSTLFTAGPGQQVERLSDRRAEVVVRLLKAGEAGSSAAAPSRTDPAASPPAADDRPSQADRDPNNYIQSDNPDVIAAAAEALKEPSADKAQRLSDWEKACRLEQYVHRTMKRGGAPQGFATAGEVVKSRLGDCTEYAVFLAALARSEGIASRVVGGLVYMEQAAGFGYHMWTEVYVDGQWVPLDATLGLGAAGPGRLRLRHSNLAAGDISALVLPVLQVVGKLQIDVVEVE